MGYTRVDERYTNPGVGYLGADFHIPSNMYELTLSYVVQQHLTRRLSAFAQAGAGVVTILPTPGSTVTGRPYAYPPVNFRPAGTTGFGFDLRLAQHLAFRAEYRGLLYKNPDFGFNLQKATTWTSQPTLSLVYRPGRSKTPGPPKTKP